MRSLLALSAQRIVLGFVVLGLLGGCSGKKVSTGVGDQTSIPGKKAEAPPSPQSDIMTEPIPPPPVEVPAESPPPPVVEPTPEPPASTAEETPPAPVAEEPPPPGAEAQEPPPAPVAEEPSPPAAEAQEPPPQVASEPEPPTSGAVPESAPLPQIAQAPEAKPVEPPPMDEPTGSLEDVYFDFDQSALRDDARAVLEDNAKLLRDTTGEKVIIEGHCDERGTSAYNLILGEQRAKSVKRYLENLGIEASSLSIVSYGKERPFCKEHNEDCWQSNRRAHFIMK